MTSNGSRCLAFAASLLLLQVAAPASALAALAEPGAPARGGGDDDELTLRLDDAIGKPGGQVSIVLRTYAARPIRQGRLGVRTRPQAFRLGDLRPDPLAKEAAVAAGPFDRLLSVTVFSAEGDSITTSGWAKGTDGQPTHVEFRSATASINAADGPLLVLKYRLAAHVAPGETYLVDFDPALTSLIDAQGQSVALDHRPAELTIRPAAGAIAIEAEGDEVEPGETATVGLHTFEPIPLAGGQMGLVYDPTVVTGPPVVRIDPRFGRASFTVRRPRPGKLVVKFTSADKSLNTVPGLLVAVDLETGSAVPVGLETEVRLDPRTTYLLDAQGRRLSLAIENGDLSFR
jgi:hypothetical protein